MLRATKNFLETPAVSSSACCEMPHSWRRAGTRFEPTSGTAFWQQAAEILSPASDRRRCALTAAQHVKVPERCFRGLVSGCSWATNEPHELCFWT